MWPRKKPEQEHNDDDSADRRQLAAALLQHHAQDPANSNPSALFQPVRYFIKPYSGKGADQRKTYGRQNQPVGRAGPDSNPRHRPARQHIKTRKEKPIAGFFPEIRPTPAQRFNQHLPRHRLQHWNAKRFFCGHFNQSHPGAGQGFKTGTKNVSIDPNADATAIKCFENT